VCLFFFSILPLDKQRRIDINLGLDEKKKKQQNIEMENNTDMQKPTPQETVRQARIDEGKIQSLSKLQIWQNYIASLFTENEDEKSVLNEIKGKGFVKGKHVGN